MPTLNAQRLGTDTVQYRTGSSNRVLVVSHQQNINDAGVNASITVMSRLRAGRLTLLSLAESWTSNTAINVRVGRLTLLSLAESWTSDTAVNAESWTSDTAVNAESWTSDTAVTD